MTRSILAAILAIGLSLVVGAAYGRGGGHAMGPHGAAMGAHAFASSPTRPFTPPGFSRGHKTGWVNGQPPGWSKGRKTGWGGAATPPGLR